VNYVTCIQRKLYYKPCLLVVFSFYLNLSFLAKKTQQIQLLCSDGSIIELESLGDQDQSACEYYVTL